MDSRAFSIFRVHQTLWLSILLSGSSAWAAELPKPPETQPVTHDLVAATSGPDNDFQIILHSHATDIEDMRKYLTFGWNGWSGHVMRWRYNDANRPPSHTRWTTTARSKRVKSATKNY